MLTPDAVHVLDRQHGVATFAQLHRAGLSKRNIQSLLGNGELLRCGNRVLRHAVVRVTHDQSCLAATLEVGADAVTSYFAAGALWEFDGFPGGLVEVTIPATRRFATRLAIVHTSKDLMVADKEELRGIPITTASRTIIDCAGRCDDRRLAAAVDSAIRDRLTTEEFLHKRASALWYEGRPGSGRLLRVLHKRPEGGLHSVLERDFKAMLDLAGIPAASQVHLRSEGEVLRVDFFVTGCSTVFEVSGHRTHSTRAARANDAKRARASWSTGSATLEFTSDEVFGTPDVVQAELFRIAELLGFRETTPRPNAT